MVKEMRVEYSSKMLGDCGRRRFEYFRGSVRRPAAVEILLQICAAVRYWERGLMKKENRERPCDRERL